MRRRTARRGATLAAALLLPLFATACSSAPTTAQLTAREKSFVTQVRDAESQDGATHAKRSDGKLASAGESTCKLMRAGNLSRAYSALLSSGYPHPDVADIESIAVLTLCTDQRPAYQNWLSTPPK